MSDLQVEIILKMYSNSLVNSKNIVLLIGRTRRSLGKKMIISLNTLKFK